MAGEPLRNVRVAAELWEPAMELARQRGETISEVIRQALRDYLDKWTHKPQQ